MTHPESQSDSDEMKPTKQEDVDLTTQTDDSEIKDSRLGGLTRRGALAGITGLGLLGLSSQSAAAATGDHIGESWSGNPSSDLGIKVNNKGSGYGIIGIAGQNSDGATDIGLFGISYSTKGKGLFGHNRSNSGDTKGLVGRVDSPDGVGLQARSTATGTGNSLAIEARQQAKDGTAIKARSFSSGTTYGIWGEVDSSDGYGLYTPNDAKIDGDLEVGGSVQDTLNVNSDLQVTGTKNFVQAVDTTAGTKNVHYTSIEAGEVRTEHTGVAEMEDGHALIELPEHFDMVTSDEEPLAVQVTANAEEKVHPQVVDKSTRYVSVEDFSDGPDDYSFSYTVKGVRAGFEDEEVVRDP